MKVFKNLLIVISVLLTLAQCQNSIESSQWRGDNRDGIYNETGLLSEWPEKGPEQLWSVEKLPNGFSTVSVANGMIYSTGIRDSIDLLFALDMQGNIQWEVPIGKAWMYSFPPSRCTPTVEGDKVYVTSGTGDVGCFNALTGDEIWLLNVSKKYEGSYGDWGIAESLLIVDDKVIFTPCGKQTTMVALNKLTGETVWKSKSLDDTPGYASPILANFDGQKVIIHVVGTNLLGVNPENGTFFFIHDYASVSNEEAIKVWTGAPFTNTNNPIYKDGRIYITSGYNHVGVMYKIAYDLSKVELEWVDTTLDVHHGGAVLIDGYIYGSNWVNNRKGNWCCVDWKTGNIMYEADWNTKGSIISAEGKLYCYDEKSGNVALVEASPESFNVISSFEVTKGKGPHWSHPVIKDGILYIRHAEALMAYNIKVN